MRKLSGFTLVELLIVMGVLAVLVVTILVSLNPSEAGKKSRDLKRMKDLATLETIILQYINDGGTLPLCSGNWCDTSITGRVPNTPPCYDCSSHPCDNNWLGINVCNYTKTVPVEPLNGKKISVVCGGTVQNPQLCINGDGSCAPPAHYAVKTIGSDYMIVAQQESKSNAANILSDGGIDWFSNCRAEKTSNTSIDYY